MDSDDDIMFLQMMEEEANIEDDEENQLVLAVLRVAHVVLVATPKCGGSRKVETSNKNRSKQQVMCCFKMCILR